LLVRAQKSSAALLEGPFFNRAMTRVDDRGDRRINRAISSVAARMLATNRISADVMVARPELTSGALSKLPLGASEEWLCSREPTKRRTRDICPTALSRCRVGWQRGSPTRTRRPRTRSNEHEPDHAFPGNCLRSCWPRPRQDGRHLLSPTLPCRCGHHRALAQDG
jgi:hypothetical protein